MLHSNGYPLRRGFDAVVIGNIPGGGMSRSASLSINLVLTLMEVNNHTPRKIPLDKEGKSYEIVDLAQQIETDYIGSPSGNLDQIMIYYAKEGLGTHYLPKTNEVRYVPLGCPASSFSIGALDTGTDRPGLEKSTYAVRKAECDELAALLSKRYPGVKTLGDVNDTQYQEVLRTVAPQSAHHKNMVDRLTYIYQANKRFATLLEAWRSGDIVTVGKVFREDGHGLRDVYKISGPELETMCDIVRSVPGVLGERMLGGGDKGASGCLILAGSEGHVKAAVDAAYPRCYPAMAQKYAVHLVKVCCHPLSINFHHHHQPHTGLRRSCRAEGSDLDWNLVSAQHFCHPGDNTGLKAGGGGMGCDVWGRGYGRKDEGYFSPRDWSKVFQPRSSLRSRPSFFPSSSHRHAHPSSLPIFPFAFVSLCSVFGCFRVIPGCVSLCSFKKIFLKPNNSILNA